MAARFHGDVLIDCAGIFTDPFAIGMITQGSGAIGCELAADLGIANDTWRQRHMQIEQIAGRAAVEHEARIGDRRLQFRRGLDIRRRQTPAAA
jgi:hypothetical protein